MKNLNNQTLYYCVGVLLLTLSNWMHGTQKMNDTVFTVCMVIVIAIELTGLVIYSKNKKKDVQE